MSPPEENEQESFGYDNFKSLIIEFLENELPVEFVSPD